MTAVWRVEGTEDSQHRQGTNKGSGKSGKRTVGWLAAWKIPHGHLYVQVPGIRNKITPFLYITPSQCQKIHFFIK